MNDIVSLKRDIADYLGGAAGVSVTAEYPAEKRAFPLREPVIIVGIDSVEAFPGGFGGCLGEDSGGSAQAVRGAAAEITLRFDLYAPANLAGNALHSMYESLCGCLMLRENRFGIRKIWCDSIAFDNASAANHMTARAALRAGFTVRDEAVPIESFHLLRV